MKKSEAISRIKASIKACKAKCEFYENKKWLHAHANMNDRVITLEMVLKYVEQIKDLK